MRFAFGCGWMWGVGDLRLDIEDIAVVVVIVTVVVMG
jgi:hypothetical protein